MLLLTQQTGEIWLRTGILLAVGVVLFGLQRLVRGRTAGSERTEQPKQ